MGHTAKQVCLVTLAITEMVAVVIAAGTVGYFIDQSDNTFDKSRLNHQSIIDFGLYGREEFFLFATGVGFFVAIFSMLIAIANLQDKIHWAAAMVAVHAFCALVLLVSASLLAKTTMLYSNKKLCKFLETESSDARCYQLIVGVVFGFVSMVLFIGDTIIYIASLTQIAGISFVNMENIAS